MMFVTHPVGEHQPGQPVRAAAIVAEWGILPSAAAILSAVAAQFLPRRALRDGLRAARVIPPRLELPPSLVRQQPCSAAGGAGRVLLPRACGRRGQRP